MTEFEFYTGHPRGGLKTDAFLPFLDREFQLQVIPQGDDGQPTLHQIEVLETILKLDEGFVYKLNETANQYLRSIHGAKTLLALPYDYLIYGIQIFGWQNPPVRSFGIFATCSLGPNGFIEWIVQNEDPVFCGPNEFHWGDGKPDHIAQLKAHFDSLKRD